MTPASHHPERNHSRARIGILVLLVASEGLGLLLGQWFFRIYQQTVPPAVVTSFNVTAAHGWFLMNGALSGLIFFIWGLLVMWLAPLFRNRPTGAASREA